MSMRVSYKKQIILLILFICIYFFSTEVFLQFYNFTDSYCRVGLVNEVDFDIQLKDELCRDRNTLRVDPVTLDITPNQDSETIHINNHGFRGDDISIAKTQGQYRIFMLGGSTMQGDLVADYQTIPYYLQQLFNQRNPELNIQVINAGCSSCHSFHETNKIKEKIINFDPDLIFVYDGWNDAVREVPNKLKGKISNAQIHVQEEQMSVIIEVSEFLRNFEIFPTINRIINYGGDSYLSLNRTIVEYDGRYTDEKIPEWVDRWNNTCNYLETHGINSVISVQPLLGSSNRELTKEEKLWYTRYDNEHLLRDLEKYASHLSKLQDCTLTLDLRDGFDYVNKPLFFDNGHVGPLGNKIMAERIYMEILPIIEESKNK